VIVKITANLCGNGESRRHWQADPRHFMKICAFATQQSFHRSSSICMAIAEIIDVMRSALSLSSGGFVRFTSRWLPHAFDSLSNVRFSFSGHKFSTGSGRRNDEAAN
jgi:hypothetical protein